MYCIPLYYAHSRVIPQTASQLDTFIIDTMYTSDIKTRDYKGCSAFGPSFYIYVHQTEITIPRLKIQGFEFSKILKV